MLLTLTVTLFFGIANVLEKVGTTGSGPGAMILLMGLVNGATWISWFLAFGDRLPSTAYSLSLAIGGGLLAVGGAICFFEAIARVTVTIAGTVIAAYPCVTVIGSYALLDERLTSLQYVGVALIVLGVMGLSLKEGNSSATYTRLGIALAIASFLAYGLWGVTSKEAIRVVGNDNLMGVYGFNYLIVATAYWWARHRGRSEHSVRDLPSEAVLIGALGLGIGAIGGILLIRALVDGPTSIVIAVSAAYPLPMIILALVFLKERITYYQIPGLVAILLGLPLVSL